MVIAEVMAGRVDAHPLELGERELALEYLARESRANLFLFDLVARLGRRAGAGEIRPEIVAAWRRDEIIGVAGLRPSVVLGAASEADETIRPATRADLDPLVVAARESLREEQRPDPFAGDAKSFRRWVRSRVDRARVVETGGRVGFAAYADVRRPEGWLLQGVYTWPEMRRRGLATAGVSKLCGEAFAGGADHVQLSVVDGNLAGRRLYEGLGFEPFAKLRTILFT